ncbi:MAG TPA: phage terminase large subunit [Bryobacteraceae bacterium]|nr:phage terminase large subunit [Bryobacteraceae bacterium]
MKSNTLRRPIKYVALSSQKKFHDSPARFKGFSGPIGSGKSQALCHEAIRLTYQNPGRTGLIGAPTYPMLKDSTLASLMECLYANELPFELYKAENVIVMKDSGSKILLRAVDEFERLRGTNLAWFGVDELTYAQEGAWSRLEGRLRDPKAKKLCGFAVWTPKGFDWVYRRFIHTPALGFETVLATPYENRFLLDQVPDFYERLKGSYDENFFRQEVMGDYLNAKGGLVYQAFTRSANVGSVSVDAGSPVYWAVDFNVDPMCSVVAQASGGEFRVLDEIVLRRASTEEACEEFEKRFGLPRAGLVVYGDASGAAMKTSGYSDYGIIREYFRARSARVSYRVPTANPAVRERVGAVNAKLRNAAGDIRLFVDPKCVELIADFEQVSYLEDSTQIDKDKDRRRTHLSDALGYLIWQESRGTVGEKGMRLF